MRVYWIESGWQSGVYNMALDESLLEWVREQAPEPTLIVRTYHWEEPTLSLGVNQAVKDIRFLAEFYGYKRDLPAVVRRPTGGRAILHGEDISFSFITNEPGLLKQSLKESYNVLSGLVETTLSQLALNVASSDNAGDREYLRSPVCFETHTPSDLLAQDGRKLSGSAQLRRQGGLLQHGAAFLKPYGVAGEDFSRELFKATAEHFGLRVGLPPTLTLPRKGGGDMKHSQEKHRKNPQENSQGDDSGTIMEPFPMERVDTLYAELEASYRMASGEILASASVTSGSHLEPASF